MAIASGTTILAADVGVFRQVQTGTVSLTFASAASNVSSVINFPVAFSAAPMMPNPNIDVSPGSTTHWVCRAINITTTGFQIFSFAADGVAAAWSAIAVSWCAISRS